MPKTIDPVTLGSINPEDLVTRQWHRSWDPVSLSCAIDEAAGRLSGVLAMLKAVADGEDKDGWINEAAQDLIRVIQHDLRNTEGRAPSGEGAQ